MKFKAVVFDLDGTLLDSLEDLADSTNQVLENHGLPTHSIDKYRYFVGNGTRELVRRALPEDRREPSAIDQMVVEMRREYAKRWDNKTRPYDGVAELLDKLVALRLKIAVLSNKPHDATEILVKKLLSRWPFDMVLGQREGIPPKPDPVGALEISDALEIPPEEFLYLGDTNVDMITANKAGMYAVGVTWGFRKAEELIRSGAKTLLDHPTELLKLL